MHDYIITVFYTQNLKAGTFPKQTTKIFSLFSYIPLPSRSALPITLRQYSIIPQNYYYISQMFYKKEVRHVIVNETHF